MVKLRYIPLKKTQMSCIFSNLISIRLLSISMRCYWESMINSFELISEVIRIVRLSTWEKG